MKIRLGCLTLSAVGVTSLSCARYEWIPDYLTPECANYHSPGSRLTFVAASGDTTGAEIVHGRVVSQMDGQGVGDARVFLRTDSQRFVVTDTSGRFRFDSVAPGRYQLRVLRVGYDALIDSLVVPVAAGRMLEAQMKQMVLDGPCSGFGTVRVRKPWWRFW